MAEAPYNPPMDRDPDPSALIARLSEGKEDVEAALLPLVYDELRSLAHHYMRSERRGHTLQTTALVHEAFLKMGGGEEAEFEGKSHFMRIAARAMRRVLIDHARRRLAEKHGGGRPRQPLEEVEVLLGEPDVDFLALDEALDKLGEMDEHLAQIVELRFFAGLSAEEAANVLGVSVRKLQYDWRMARAWLKQAME